MENTCFKAGKWKQYPLLSPLYIGNSEKIENFNIHILSWFTPKICAGFTLTILFYTRQEQYIDIYWNGGFLNFKVSKLVKHCCPCLLTVNSSHYIMCNGSFIFHKSIIFLSVYLQVYVRDCTNPHSAMYWTEFVISTLFAIDIISRYCLLTMSSFPINYVTVKITSTVAHRLDC